MHSLTPILEPRSVIVVGASRTQGKAGYEILANLRANGYEGRVYPVNPSADEILGFKVYHSVLEVPEPADLAVLIVPAASTLEVFKQCIARGVKAVIISAGGFSELDETGKAIQDEIVRLARESGVRVLGPNTSGVVSTPQNFTTTFFPQGRIRRGPIAYIAQTGNFATHTMRWIQSAENFGVSRVIGLGNKCDIDDADALEYLGHDPETKAIAMYLEGFKDGRRFIEVASKVSRVKPIIALKGGRTSAGARAALSHTASLAGDDRIIDAAFRQAGIVRVQNYSDLIDCAKALAFQPLPRGDGVAILAPSGAMGVIASDACESMGLRVATLSRKTTERIASISPSWIRIGNPVDIWAAVSIHGVEFAYCEGLKAVLADEAVDSAIVILLLVRESAPKSLDFIADICRNNPTKPVLVTITGEKELFEKAKADLERRSVPVYYPLEGAFRALAIMTLCAKRIAR